MEESKGHAQTMTPGSFGRDMPTKTSGRQQGQKTVKSDNPGQGNRRPSSAGKGSGGTQKNVKSRDTRGKAPSVKGAGKPSMQAIQHKLSGPGPHGKANVTSRSDRGGGRTGMLANFEGYNK